MLTISFSFEYVNFETEIAKKKINLVKTPSCLCLLLHFLNMLRELTTSSIILTALVFSFLGTQAPNQMAVLSHINKPSLFYLDGLPKQYLNVSNLEVDTRDNLKITFKGKTIVEGAFLTCYSAQPSVASNGDSFYKVATEVLDQCSQQRITNVTQQEWVISIEGGFDDCFGERFSLTASLWKQNAELTISCSNRSASLWLHDEPTDQYFGLGEQFSYLSLGDRPYSLLVREKGVGRGDQPLTFLSQLFYGKSGAYYSTYSPSPIWFSSRRLAYAAHTFSYAIWRRNWLVLWERGLTLTVVSRPTYKLLVGELAKVNGYTQPLPEWVNSGVILGLQGGSGKVRAIVQRLVEAGGKVAGVWLQDWVGKRMSMGYSRLWWNWELDERGYPDWREMREYLESKGINLLVYVNPMLTDVTNKTYYRSNFYAIAKQNNYLVKDAKNGVFETSAFSDFTAGLIDLYNPEARSFYKKLIKDIVVTTGAKGMMVDFGEAYPLQPPSQSPLHNRYPVEWSRLVSQALSQLPHSHSFFTFSRSSYLGSPPHTHSLWAGDQNMNYGEHSGLPSCLTAMLSSGLVGFANSHCDVGGYVCVRVAGVELAGRDRGLLERWMGVGAFSPVFRTHEGNRPEQTRQVWEGEREFVFYSSVYAVLAEYRREQGQRAKEEGLPLVRAMFLQLQDDRLADIKDQYYLGEWILVAPLLTDKLSREVYLPQGTWLDIWTGTPLQGCDCHLHLQSSGPPLAYLRADYPNSPSLLASLSALHRQFALTADQL